MLPVTRQPQQLCSLPREEVAPGGPPLPLILAAAGPSSSECCASTPSRWRRAALTPAGSPTAAENMVLTSWRPRRQEVADCSAALWCPLSFAVKSVNQFLLYIMFLIIYPIQKGWRFCFVCFFVLSFALRLFAAYMKTIHALAKSNWNHSLTYFDPWMQHTDQGCVVLSSHNFNTFLLQKNDSDWNHTQWEATTEEKGAASSWVTRTNRK